MSVERIQSTNPLNKILAKPIHRSIAVDAPKQSPATDKLELSGLSHLLQTLKTTDVRTDKVAAIKAQIESGTYESDHKLNTAVDRMLDDVLK